MEAGFALEGGTVPNPIVDSTLTHQENQIDIAPPGLGANGFAALVDWIDDAIEDASPCGEWFDGFQIRKSTLENSTATLLRAHPPYPVTNSTDHTFTQRAFAGSTRWDVTWKWQGIDISSGVNSSALSFVDSGGGQPKYKIENNTYCSQPSRVQVTQYLRYQGTGPEATQPVDLSDPANVNVTPRSLAELGFASFFTRADQFYASQAALGLHWVLDRVYRQEMLVWEVEISLGEGNTATLEYNEKYFWSEATESFLSTPYNNELSVKLEFSDTRNSTEAMLMAKRLAAYTWGAYLLPRELNTSVDCSFTLASAIKQCAAASTTTEAATRGARHYTTAVAAILGTIAATLLLSLLILFLHKRSIKPKGGQNRNDSAKVVHNSTTTV